MKFWYNKNLIAFLLYPFSLIFTLIVSIRKFCYNVGLCKTYFSPIPVIVVGNITVGGCGKTPCVEALYKFLKSEGFKPAIVSRGYGGKANHYPLRVTAETDATVCGDEPLLLAKSDCKPLLISPKRVLALQELVRSGECDVIISDDGLQHYAMYRDIEIALFDRDVEMGNGFMLPAGLLREPVRRLQKADFILYKGGLPNTAIRYPEESFAMDIKFAGVYGVSDFNQQIDLTSLKQARRVVAVAAIANPESFQKTLKSIGIDCELKSFPDHHNFSFAEIDYAADYIIMTAKDAVKCESFADDRHVFIAIDALFNAEFSSALKHRLQEIV